MTPRQLICFFITILIAASTASAQVLQRYEFESQHMGTTFQIILYAENNSLAEAASDNAFKTVEELNSILSDYLPSSELSQLSQTAGSGNAVKVSPPLFDLLMQSKRISEETNGWFDITIGPYTHIWRGLNRMSEPELPSDKELSEAASHVGYKKIVLDEARRTAELKTKGMRLDPGGIGKGFASDRALKTLQESGITQALINAGGDISAGDPPPGKEGWSIAVPVRFDEDSVRYEELIISNRAVNTSGSLYQSVEIDGKSYSHIINPKTGLGHTHQVQVTTISLDGAAADAFATALSVMPSADAQELVESKADIEAVIFWLNDDGTIVRWISSGYDDFLKQ
ncbi:FAD:protein FMN transferase [Rhodohalobacter sp. 8-1]|uniref:FAD:protein FMN transferase n=1 Tax=Rhodohalobacter sp. 8-1 TaxID=3131972 RepID=UPI0030ED4035